LVAQKLNIPIFGVNLPQHFVMAYMDSVVSGNLDALYKTEPMENKKEGQVLFYINAFNLGAVFSKANLEQFLKQVGIEPKYEFFLPCSNLDIVKRILRNLSAAYEKSNKIYKQNEILEILLLLGEPNLNAFTEFTSDEPENDE
jgi:regulator of sirC expression with transglutaminase-like and TPR domain